MVRPTTVPQTGTELQVEQAVTREALRLALAHHVASLTGLRGVGPVGPAAHRLGSATATEALDWARITLVLGSGGPLAHAPRPVQAAAMLVDGLRPRGLTSLAVDAGFLMPHLGVLARRDPEAARQVLLADCLVPLGAAVAPLDGAAVRPGRRLLDFELVPRGGSDGVRGSLVAGQLDRLPLPPGASARLSLRPAPEVDVGAGPGTPLEALVAGGAAGVILDGRGDDLGWPQPPAVWRERVASWQDTLAADAEVPA
jgi:hypothetical protein